MNDYIDTVKRIPRHLLTLFLSGFCILNGCHTVVAQTILYPGLTGGELLSAVQSDYTPFLHLDYGQARDTLYANIDRMGDSIYTIYTDYPAFLDDAGDPTVVLFDQGVNTEHIYPQGRGATDGTPPYHNMYNLAAARVDVNQDRANLPFGEIPDNQTDTWYYKADQMTSPPSSNRDAYSESNHSTFEPRESVKGNIARSMFYIYSIYQDQIDAVDPHYFEEQLEDLCAWHFQDPVDEAESDRNAAIALYQDGKPNPFILDCTLADRLYCGNMGPCMVSLTDEPLAASILVIIGTALTSDKYIVNSTNQSQQVTYTIYTMQGIKMWHNSWHRMAPNESSALSMHLPTGTYLVELLTDSGWRSTQIIQYH